MRAGHRYRRDDRNAAGVSAGGEIARGCDFFSFGTNDLTQLAFGLSRDDAGTFMPEYRNLGLLAYNPFRVLDDQGVGELLAIAVERGGSRGRTCRWRCVGSRGLNLNRCGWRTTSV